MQKQLFKVFAFLAILLLAENATAQVPIFPSIAANPALPVFNANDVSFLNKDTAVAVGNNGMSWRSTDGGLNWNIIPTFTSTTNNNSVIMLGKYICVAGDLGTVTFSNDRGISWQNATAAQPLINYRGVHFADTTFGAAVGDAGDAVIYHWVGGLNWAHIASTQTVNLNAVAAYKTSASVFVDGFAFAVGDNGAVSTYSTGSWNNLVPPTTRNLNGVYLFPTNDTVLAVGDGGLILRSPDYGNTWTTQNNTGKNLRDIGTGLTADQFIAVGDSGVIFVSNDRGNTFTEFTVGFGTTNLKGVSAKDPRGAFAGSGNVLRVFTTDTVNITYINDSLLCPGDNFKVAIDLRGLFGTNNTVDIELSDSSGSFVTPVNIGSKLNPSLIDTIVATIPSNAKASVLYQLRASSSDPIIVSDIPPFTITVNAMPNNVTVLVINATDLFVNSQAGCTYQWYYNSNPMGGATDTIVTTIGNGNYYVVVTGSNGCTALSNVFNYNATGIKSSAATRISVTPNPADEICHITVPENLIGKILIVYDALGAKIISERIKTATNSLATTTWEPGVYFIVIENKISKLVITR